MIFIWPFTKLGLPNTIRAASAGDDDDDDDGDGENDDDDDGILIVMNDENGENDE